MYLSTYLSNFLVRAMATIISKTIYVDSEKKLQRLISPKFIQYFLYYQDVTSKGISEITMFSLIYSSTNFGVTRNFHSSQLTHGAIKFV